MSSQPETYEGMDGRMHLKYPRDPLIHSGVTDVLPDDHPLAFTSLNCRECGLLIHAFNNECMTTWIETGRGNFCLPCFFRLYQDDAGPAEADWGLP